MEEVVFLERQFIKEEIWCALQDSDSTKAPGPYCINSGWLKKLPMIADQVVHFFNKFHNKAYIPAGANSSIIVLIPKKHNPELLADFRPISLINSSFKLLFKV